MTSAEHLPKTRLRDISSREWRLRIGSDLRAGSGSSTVIVNPSDGSTLAEVASASTADVNASIQQAASAAKHWAALTPRDRGRIVRAFADVLEAHVDELAWLDTLNAGLPLWMMRIDAATGIERMRMFADLGLSLGGRTIPASSGNLHLTFPEPFGVVARIIPFNHPFMFAASKLAAPLVAGNAVILKPSELTPLSALRMGELAVGVLPEGLLSVLHGGPDVGDALVRHPGVPRIAFTGSHGVGRAIQRSAAEVGVKQVSLELGGKNALLLFEDADLNAAVASAVKGMNFAFAGQSCGSTSRILVQGSRREEFTEKYVAAVGAVRQGMPWEDGVQIGPMISGRQRDRALGFIERACAEGGSLLQGGSAPELPGYFLEPTVLDQVRPDSEIAQEEVFGPVVSLMTFEEEEEALAIANSVEYGLTGSIWTRDLSRAHRLARALDSGYIWINDSSTHFPGVPFGGIKLSGVGREESFEELLDYTWTKAVNVVVS